ncbi:hypothetical protein [Aurantiacibacter sp. D1-12]|uniref:hypothetical protein n=1 Tax=Aurantiacibacter sp. D1-12 TaxID=2993658 RepID=UPI00237D140B|nr:hypothetical protein [Aurantiacibacter sp. D1-12]MDE1468324.1 hypothetical protein [Aurantiacibacter sp. D1-12]
MVSAQQFARTVQLFQDDLGIKDADSVLRALTGASFLLVADEATVSTLSGQVAITTSAFLMARSGHRVFLDLPDAPLIGDQPPMNGSTLYEALQAEGGQIVDGLEIAIGCPLFEPDVAFVFGSRDLARFAKAKRVVSVGWTDWAGELGDYPYVAKAEKSDWPIGGMIAATLVAAEAIKVAGRRMLPLATRNAGHFRELFEDSQSSVLRLAHEDTPKISQLGRFDVISAGAVTNATLYALLRLPQVSGVARVFDRDVSDETNRNRNMLLTCGFLGLSKVELFKAFENGLKIEPVARHFQEQDLEDIAQSVIVGVDDIPIRWLIARAAPSWMSVGATSHFAAMSSVHFSTSGCAGCLHPHDEEQDGPIPTISFVSFLAGLMTAVDFLRDAAGVESTLQSRQRFLSPLQVAGDYTAGVPPREDCPVECAASTLKRGLSA